MADDIHIVLELPAEALSALIRIADAFDRISPISTPLTPEEQEELDKLDTYEDDAAQVRRETELAALERLELRGEHVPEAVYKRLNIPAPNRKLSEPTSAEVLNANQSELAKPLEPQKPPEPIRPVDHLKVVDEIISARKAGL